MAAGDYRDLDRCAPARLLTALALVADPTDALAWRAWCGFGDYLANSPAFADMRAEGETQGKGLVAMLEEVAVAAPEEGLSGTGIGRILDAYRAGRAIVERSQVLEGNELIGALADALDLSAEECERTMQLASALTAPEPSVNAPCDARAMIARARQRMNAPVFETTEDHVLIGDSAHLTGRTPATLVLAVASERLLPRARLLLMPSDSPRTSRSSSSLPIPDAFTLPQVRRRSVWRPAGSLPSDSVEAETLKLKSAGVKLRCGERIAVTAPSIYLADIDPGAETCTMKLPKPQPQHPHPKPLRRGDTAAPLPPPHAPLASGRPPSPHTPAPAFIRPPGPAPIGKALVEADELPAGSPESSCLGRPIRKPPPGEVRAARDLGSANLPLRGLFPLPAPQTF